MVRSYEWDMMGKAGELDRPQESRLPPLPPHLDALLLLRAACPSLGLPPSRSYCPVVCVPESEALTSVAEGIGDLTHHLTHNPSKWVGYGATRHVLQVSK